MDNKRQYLEPSSVAESSRTTAAQPAHIGFSVPQQAPPSPPPYEEYVAEQEAPTNRAIPAGPITSQHPPISIPLVNPLKPQNGFSMAVPPHLATMLRTDEGTRAWQKFMEELNEIMHKIPGSVAKGVAGFWLFNLATLGMAYRSCGMYENHVVDQAMHLVERYNCYQFASLGINVSLKTADYEGAFGNSRDGYDGCSRHGRREDARHHDPSCQHAGPEKTFVLIVNHT
ncbi:hypothetical protein IWW36_001399 [Coemansia brasiliensis]|uniref:Uncharacterized protein n=1 Tax=Coemansia brasiliensis TaxID=2650707 RepID=A0A9W8IFH0_9FUNG|nr:hypothetical protein IWW36_001399 [Coemansia brasiliensis]